ncbi:alpha carbonic anhydrase 2 [Perilla frutescens var. hirtella]|uniref:Alpha carbonic anhydrase 2 n=1 Tax=Perilla frutescens var. hirtella TaxID=608512 RepID=A0AAD4P5U4_PERFH|nr:alpha carbonic anhydrase 2 [Perilla frutescens var. hirtella]
MEVHLVHESSDNRTAVIGIMYKIGRPDSFLSMLKNDLETLANTRGVKKGVGIIDPDFIKFGSRKYYRYIGSLTTPPCTQNIIWTIVTKAVMEMNKAQEEAVRQLGFGSILHLDINQFPQKITYWLLENFDPVSRELQLQHGRRLRIEVSDVSVIFNFPRGPHKIQKSVRGQICQVMQKDELLTSILSYTTAGEWFKMNFMILVITSMIENYEDGHIYKNLMDCLQEIDNVSQYDWCEYVLRSLVNHTIKWKSNKTMPFTGPILFLLPAYTMAEFIEENRERACQVEEVLQREVEQEQIPNVNEQDIASTHKNQREDLAKERQQQEKGKGLAVEIPETKRCSSNTPAIKRPREEAYSEMPTETAETTRVSKKKKAVIQTSTVSARSRAIMKQPDHFRNLVDTRETLTPSDCELHYWAMENKSDDESYAVIDVWSSILNYAQAKIPEQQTPRRFFPTTNVSNYTVVAPPGGWNDKKISKLFVDNILHELRKYPHVEVDKTDMFFFPILQSEHFYIIVIDTRRMVAEIIDNFNAMEGEQDDPLFKYEHIPAKLMTGLQTLTKEVSENIKSMNRLQMPWRNSTNQTDCGVFVMHHMETYMGDAVRNWRSGLRAKNEMQLKYLRIKYCAAILTAECNIHRQRNIRDSRLYFRASSKDNLISFEKLYLEDDNQ